MGGHFDYSKLKDELNGLQKESSDPLFYNDIKRSAEVNSKIVALEKEIKDYDDLYQRILDDIEYSDIVESEEISILEEKIENLEKRTYLSGRYDSLNAFLEIHAGAGGTEAMDWCEMLLIMYERFCEKNGFKYEEISSSKGDEAGLKSVMIKITGLNAFGYLKNESGIHRLVRISPFDSNKRRHTSFASVNITPEFGKIDFDEIKESDLKIDVYHSSGAGGQSVNTSNSAVRITHLPSKIVVTCQNERSQLKNKEIALEILKAKLYSIKLKEEEEKVKGFKNTSDINFGSQIRSYILEPYKLVKDHRSCFESNEPEKVLNGEIISMLEYNLKNIK